MEDPFIFLQNNFSSLEIPNLNFLPFTFLSFLFYFILAFFFLFLLLSCGPLILLPWPIFPPGPAHPAARFSPSSSLGANRS
jgi:hypothetical protein